MKIPFSNIKERSSNKTQNVILTECTRNEKRTHYMVSFTCHFRMDYKELWSRD